MSNFGVQGQLLEVTVVGCNKLKDTERISRQDPHVCLEYGSTKFRTRTNTASTNSAKKEKNTASTISGSNIQLCSILNSSSSYHPMSNFGIQGQLLEVTAHFHIFCAQSRLCFGTVVGCNKLKDTQRISRQDPHVCLEYGSTKFRTRTCTGLIEINVAVWNSNTLTVDDFIGSGKVQLGKVPSQGFEDTTRPLQTKTGSDKEARSSTNFLGSISFFFMVIFGILGLSVPLGAIKHSFIMVVALLCTALLGMELGPENADYLPMFKNFCVFCAFLAWELLMLITVDPLWQVVITLCLILLELTRRKYKQIYEHLCHISHWVQHKTKGFNKFTLFGGSTEKQAQDEGGRIADMV